MQELVGLWLPIILSAVLVFIASSILWMATPFHKNDFKDPGEKEGPLLDALKSLSFAPGVYYVPWCKGKDKGAMESQMKSGPWAMLTVMGCPPSFGKSLGLWFVHLLIVGVFVAYVAQAAMDGPQRYLHVFQVVGATALLAHAGGALPMAIWHGMPCSQLFGRLFDGVVYALLTAGVFAWQWPHDVAGAMPAIPGQ